MRRLKALTLLLLTTILLAGCFSIPIGDGNKVKLSKKGVTLTDEDGKEHSITVDEEEGQVTMKGFGMEDDEGEMKFGGDLEVPDSLPKDIPIASDADIIQSSIVQSVTSISYTTEIDISEIEAMYEAFFGKDIFNGKPSVMEQRSDGYLFKMIEGERDDGNIFVQINGSNEDEEATQVTIVFTEPNESE